MPKMILLESRVVGAKHLHVSFGELVVLELDVGKFQCADAVSYLRESVFLGVCCFVEHGLLGQDEVKRAVESLCHHLLPIVVIDLHALKLLEVSEVVSKEDNEVSLEPSYEIAWFWNLSPSIGKGYESERSTTAKCLEA